ncbi:MAG: hypothetical protein JSU98_08575 [Gemmatimonadales bacterium]|nr:MAG: hypothetical protein JSU98_08575 [Gemmatimonadales bacterium]
MCTTPRSAGQRSREVGETRTGAALVMVVLVSIALAAIGHAVLVMTRTEAWIVRAEARRLERSYGASAALAAAVEGMDSLPGDEDLGTPYAPVRAARLSPEVALLTTGGPGSEARGSVVYAPSASERIGTRLAGARLGGTLEAGVGSAVAVTPALERIECPPDVAAPPGLAPWSGSGAWIPHPGLGPVDLSSLRLRLPDLSDGSVDLGPLEAADGTCVPAGGNWGDPARPGGGCTTVWGRGGSLGDTELAGSGQGLLVVEGSLSMDPGARFRGWILVSGHLWIGMDAEVRGLVDVGGNIRLEPGARLEAEPCSAAWALHEATELRAPWTVGPTAWPSF